MTQGSIDDYYAALERLKNNKPLVVSKGTKITNDSVALEAGRKKGSIKKCRTVFTELIKAIDDAAVEKQKNTNRQKEQIAKASKTIKQYRMELDEGLAREMSLLLEIYSLKKKIARLTGEKVLPLR